MRSFKRILKILALFFGGVIAFLFLLAVFTQTQMFRDRLRAYALSNLDSLLDAEVQLGTLTGNLIKGFSVDQISIKVGNQYFVAADRLDLRYDPLELPGKLLAVNEITIVRPRVNLLRGSDGVWNFERMIRRRPPDTAAGGPFNWVIRVHRLEIQEGTITLVDSAALDPAGHEPHDTSAIDYHHFTLQQFNLVTSALLKEDERRAAISSLSFVSYTPQFRLKECSGEFVVTPSSAVVNSLRLTTERSHVEASVSLRDVDLFGGVDLRHLQRAPLRGSLHAHDLNFAELKKFIPQLDFLQESVAADFRADGEFGDLRVRQLDLKTGRTSLYLKGDVLNLHDPGNLWLDVKCTESKLYGPDLQKLMPTFGLPAYPSFGVTTLNMEFDGHPWNFKTKFLYETDAGNLRGTVALVIGGPATLAYQGEIVTRNLDLAKVLDNSRFKSTLNGAAQIKGEGTRIDRLDGTCSIKLDSSEFMEQPLVVSEVSVRVQNRVFAGTLNLGLGTMRADFSATLDERDATTPSFSVHGTVSSLNLESILRDASYNSSLTMSVNAAGTGLTWDELNGEFIIGLQQSRLGEYRISSDSIRVLLDQHNPLQKNLTVASTIADLSLRGAYSIEYLARLLPFEVQNVREAIAEKFRVVDTSLTPIADDGTLLSARGELAAMPSRLDASYALHIKDLEPISIVTGNRVFNGSGVFSGTVTGDYRRLQLHSKLLLEDFFYGNVESGVLIQMGEVSFDVDNLVPDDPLKYCNVRLVLDAGLMHVNRTELDSARLTFIYQHEYAMYTTRGIINKEMQVIVQGLSSVSEDQVLFTLNDFQVAYSDYQWKADGGATVGFGARGMRVHGLVMRSGSQVVALSGSIGVAGALEASIRGDHLDLAALKYLSQKEESRPREQSFEGVASFSADAKGTLSSPMFTLSLRADNVSFREVPFGTIHGDLTYDSLALHTQVYVVTSSDTSRRHQLTITGTLPVNLGLTGVEDRLPDAPMDFSIHSDGIQMNILDPLVPTFERFTGLLRCDVRVVGSPRKPDYEGTIRIDSCSFLFIPNNIVYLVEGSFQPQGDRIKVVDAIVRNIPGDEQFKREGLVHVSGDFALREFKPTDFNLSARGQLLVVKETTRQSELSVYGNLFVVIGDQGLHFTGSIENSLLTGNLIVRNSSLVFPPVQSVKAQQLSTTVPLLIVNDTIPAVQSQPRASVSRYFGTRADSVSRRTQLARGIEQSRSFIDGLHYDLDITTEGGNTELRMQFFAAPPEELDADIDGRFTITEDGKRWYGDLRVDKANYDFYGKRFDAQGTLRFTGDFMNPELDVTATYTGTRTRDDSTASSGKITEPVVVTVHITGSRMEAKIGKSMTIDGEDYTTYKGPKSGDVESDVFAFLIAGRFPWTQAEKNDVAANIGRTFGASLVTGATSLLSGALSEFVRRQTGFITSLELGYGSQGDFGSTPDIRLSGVAAGGLWRYGGKVSDPLTNANVSILYSLGDVFDANSLRNFMLELERRVEASTTVQARDQAIKSARLFYRISF